MERDYQKEVKKSYFDESKQLEQEIVEFRSTLRQIPALGFDLEKTNAYVIENLISFGYEQEEIEMNEKNIKSNNLQT